MVEINRVAKVVKGGRRFSFTALVVVGDEVDRVGVGYGKAREVPLAITKAVEDAKKNMFTVPKHGSTITHEVLGRFDAARVMLRPASEGTGVIAGGGVRAVLELGGVRNVLAKSLGTTNPINMAKATVVALQRAAPSRGRRADPRQADQRGAAAAEDQDGAAARRPLAAGRASSSRLAVVEEEAPEAAEGAAESRGAHRSKAGARSRSARRGRRSRSRSSTPSAVAEERAQPKSRRAAPKMPRGGACRRAEAEAPPSARRRTTPRWRR